MMKVLLLLVGLFCCLAMASASKDIPKNMRILMSAKRALDKKQGGGGKSEFPACYGAKCMCADFELLGAFVGTMGNLVATCEISKLWQATQSEKRQSEYDFYEEGCNFLDGVAAQYENGELDGEIFSCCEVREALVAFHCLNTYMTLAEMRFLRFAAGVSGKVLETSKMVTHLEFGMEQQCNAIYMNPTCLVMGMNEDPNLESCVEGPSDMPDVTAEPAPDATVAPARKTEDLNKEIETLLRTLLKRHN